MSAVATAPHGVPEDDLIGRCRAHDQSAWRQLYDEHFPFVFRVARRLGTPREELDDVVQEVFMVVHQNIESFEGGRLTTWMYRICSNVVMDRHRRRRVRQAFLQLKRWFTASVDTPELQAQRNSAERTVERIFARMAAKKREVLALYELEQLGVDEIAERLGCSPGTVKSRLHHARAEFTAIARKMGCLDPEALI